MQGVMSKLFPSHNCSVFCTHSFTFCVFAYVVTLFNKDSKCVFHMGDVAVGSFAPLTFEALGIPLLYDDLDTFSQKLTVSLAYIDLAMASARAIDIFTLLILIADV